MAAPKNTTQAKPRVALSPPSLDYEALDTMVADLNSVYADSPALWSQDSVPEGFQWIEADDSPHNTVAFVRWGSDGSALVCVTNFSAIPHEGYRIGLPRAGRWDEVINTDSELYGGSGVGNLGGVDTDGLSSSTMQSKHVPGLYFIGEVVDVTGWLGGYNFQWAWASAHAAGTALLA